MNQAGDGAAPARRKHGARKNWRDIFIARLAETSNVQEAAEEAGIRLSHAYQIRRQDPEFAGQWFNALCEGYDILEMDLLYRLRSGKIEEIDEEGNKRKFDVATAFKILTAHREQMGTEKQKEHTGDEKTIVESINKKIEVMRARENEVAAMLAKDGIMLARVPNGTR